MTSLNADEIEGDRAKSKWEAELAFSLQDWLDFHKTPRKVFARRPLTREMRPYERLAMREAKLLLDEGKISILSRVERNTFNAENTVVYVAERVIW